VGWLSRRFTDEGDQIATLKLLGGVLLHPLWAMVLAASAGLRWGWGAALIAPAALVVSLMGRPLLERAAEDLQAIRGFFRRRDPAVPELIEARRQLLETFPELRGR
jgi:hypothetical protein